MPAKPQLKTTFTRVNSRTWAWTIKRGNQIAAGGYCRTKRDCRNDAGKWLEFATKHQD